MVSIKENIIAGEKMHPSQLKMFVSQQEKREDLLEELYTTPGALSPKAVTNILLPLYKNRYKKIMTDDDQQTGLSVTSQEKLVAMEKEIIQLLPPLFSRYDLDISIDYSEEDMGSVDEYTNNLRQLTEMISSSQRTAKIHECFEQYVNNHMVEESDIAEELKKLVDTRKKIATFGDDSLSESA